MLGALDEDDAQSVERFARALAPLVDHREATSRSTTADDGTPPPPPAAPASNGSPTTPG